jgi:hypothetical protein
MFRVVLSEWIAWNCAGAHTIEIADVFKRLLFFSTLAGVHQLLIGTRKTENRGAGRIAEFAAGLAPATLGQVFDALYTTKSSGLGRCRSIFETPAGRDRVPRRVVRLLCTIFPNRPVEIACPNAILRLLCGSRYALDDLREKLRVVLRRFQNGVVFLRK